MVDVSKVDSIELDIELFNKPKITFKDKDGFTIHEMHPKPDKAWDVFHMIVKNWEKEKKKCS